MNINSINKLNICYMETARIFAKMSHCSRKQVGSVAVKDGNIIAIGWNGTPAGFENTCEQKDGLSKPEVLHAESNVITKLAKSNNSSKKCMIFVTLSPCVDCAKLIIQAGVRTVFFEERYKGDQGAQLLQKAGVEVFMMNETKDGYDCFTKEEK